MALVQLILGTQGREQIDRYLHGMSAPPRSQWYDSLTGVFHVHHLWAYVLAGSLILLLWHHRKSWGGHPLLVKINVSALLVMMAQLLSGMAFKHLDFVAWNQPLHLLLASLLISLFFTGLRVTAHPLPGPLKRW